MILLFKLAVDGQAKEIFVGLVDQPPEDLKSYVMELSHMDGKHQYFYKEGFLATPQEYESRIKKERLTEIKGKLPEGDLEFLYKYGYLSSQK